MVLTENARFVKIETKLRNFWTKLLVSFQRKLHKHIGEINIQNNSKRIKKSHKRFSLEMRN